MKSAETRRVLIDDELAAFLMGGNSFLVATRNAALEPYATRVCGLRVHDGDRISVLMPYATSAQALANLEDNGQIAIVISSPRTFRAVQLKGRFLGAQRGTEEDVLLAQEQLRGLTNICVDWGYSRQQCRNLWMFENWRVDVQVTEAYAQTPGPGAGARLGERG